MALRILVADDELLVAETLAEVLRMDGHHVDCVASGVGALAHIANDVPDVLLTDLMMPQMDGAALIRELRQSPTTARLPIVLMTGAPEAAGKAVGFDVLLTKPFRSGALRKGIERAIALRRH